jgi:predicted N-acetyltransferase YhbS
MTIRIRRATVEDYRGIEALLHDAYPAPLVGLLTERLQEKLQSNTCYSLVAVDESAIIGHASIDNLDTSRVHFGSLAVSPTYRQRGIATALTTAKIKHLEQLRFQGIAVSEAVTHHPYSQQSLLQAGFYPVRVLLGRHSHEQLEPYSSVGFVRLFQPPTEKTRLYLPEQYRGIASSVLAPIGTFAYRDSDSQETSKRIQEIHDEELCKPNALLAVRLYEKTAPAEIAYLQERGFVIAGFYPVFIEENSRLSVVTHMHRVPSHLLDKTQIHVIPTVEQLFDFVWQQYEAQNVNK